MKRGVLLFAFNTGEVDYVKMAYKTSLRVNQYLNLPCTLITDKNTSFKFDQKILTEKNSSNIKNGKVWNNKNRYQAFELSPYDETIILDVDYVINSQQLLKVFDFYQDFCIHNTSNFLMCADTQEEQLSPTSFDTLWATVTFFKKTKRVKYFFDCVKMVQDNYNHYVNLHNMWSSVYRNDHAFAISNRICNGHLENNQDYIPWKLLHVNEKTCVEKLSNTKYKITLLEDKTKYIIIRDTDFHMMNKNNFMELFCE